MLRKSLSKTHSMHKNYPFIPILFFIAFVFTSCSQKKVINEEQKEWLQQQDSITVAMYPYHPPYQVTNKKGNIEGIFSDYLELIEQKIGYTFHEKIYATWPAVMEDIRKEKIDIIVEIHPTKNREEYLNFYGFLFESPHVIVNNTNNLHGLKVSDYYNKTIVLPKEYAIVEILKQKYPKLNISTEEDELTCLQQLNAGKYDAYIGPKSVVHYEIETKNLENLKIVAQTDLFYRTGIAVHKKNKILDKIIKQASNSITKSEKQAILDNWIYNVITPFYYKTQFWVLFSITIAILLLTISLLNNFLKFKIKQKTKELHIAKENAEESDRLKTNFIRNISHEIRTPMNGIIGFSEFLNNPDLTPDERQEYTRIIINSGKQLMSIIEDILEISKLRSKQVKVNVEKTNLIVLLNALFSIFEIKAKEKNIDLYLENGFSEDQNLILIDKSKLNKILSNLLDNAIKFTNEGYVKINYKIENQFIIISIEDTGIGINSKDQENIFRSFSQSEKEISKNYGGLGLGLTLAKENIALIGGRIKFKSKEGKGSTFTITLPHNPVQSNIIRTSIEHKKKYSGVEKQIILIAEDGEVNFLFLKTVLIKMQDYDFVIHRAKDGKEAVNLCEYNSNIDLVLMDIKMPIMDGYDATKHIKKLRPKLPVIAQTAYSTEEDIQKALDAGCDDFISKPVDRKILKPILKKYFKIKQSQYNS